MSWASKLVRIAKIIGYIIILVANLIHLLFIYVWYKTVYYFKWRIALHRTKKQLKLSGLSGEEADQLARRLTPRPPSLWGLLKRIRRS